MAPFIPIIEVGEVAVEVRDKVLFETSVPEAVVPLPSIPITVGDAQLIVILFVFILLRFTPYPQTIPFEVPV